MGVLLYMFLAGIVLIVVPLICWSVLVGLVGFFWRLLTGKK